MNATKERKPPQRLIALIETSPIGESLVEIKMQRSANRWEITFYIVSAFASDFGSAFRVEKQDADGTSETHDVCLDHDGAGNHLCSCRGFGRWGRCKHVDGVAALVAAGLLQPMGQADTADDAAEREAIEAENVPDDETAFWREMGYPDDGADVLSIGEPDTAA